MRVRHKLHAAAKGTFINYVTAMEGGRGSQEVLRVSQTELMGPLRGVTEGRGLILSEKSVT